MADKSKFYIGFHSRIYQLGRYFIRRRDMPTLNGIYGKITLTCSSQVNIKRVLLVSQTADFINLSQVKSPTLPPASPPSPPQGKGGVFWHVCVIIKSAVWDTNKTHLRFT